MNQMRKLILALGALALSSQANAANMLTNGSFEMGSDGLAGWTVTNIGPTNSNAVVIAYGQNGNYPVGAFGEAVPAVNSPIIIGSFVNPDYDGTGTHGLYLSSDTGTQTISQTISLAAGNYTFGFDFYLPQNGVNNPNGATFTAYVGTQEIGSFNAATYGAQQWYTFTGSSTLAAAGDFTFSFTANGDAAKDFVIDNVFLAPTDEQSGVPEAGTWAMMVLGFGTIGAATRRRRTSLTFG
jgi:hypothetical protein